LAVAFACFVVYAYVVTSVGPVLPRLSDEFMLRPNVVGALMGLSSIGGLLAVLGGWISDKLNKVTVSAFSMATLALASTTLWLAPNAYAVAFSLALMSTSAGFLESAINSFVSNLYPEKRGLTVNLLHIGWNVGSALGPSLAALIIVVTGTWRKAYLFPLPALIFISVLLARLSKIAPKTKSEDPYQHDSVSVSTKSIFKFLPIALTGFFYVGSEMGISTWLAFILEGLGSQLLEAGLTTGLFWGLMGLGRLVWAPAIDKLGYRRSIITASGCVVACMFAAAFVSPLHLKMVLWMLCGFFFAPIFPTLIAWGTSINPSAGGTVSGLIFTLGTLGLFSSNSSVGMVAAFFGPESAQYVFVFFAIAMFANVLITHERTKQT